MLPPPVAGRLASVAGRRFFADSAEADRPRAGVQDELRGADQGDVFREMRAVMGRFHRQQAANGHWCPLQAIFGQLLRVTVIHVHKRPKNPTMSPHGRANGHG